MKDNRLYLIHIQECLDRIRQYLGDSGKPGFMGTPMLQDAVVRNLQILSESTQRLSEEFKARHPDVEWHKISGFRNIIVHEYLSLDLERVWLIIENDLPGLESAVGRMLDEG
jgi:uncharacterized protein with HEPN domain